MGFGGADDDENDSDLEAELAAIAGGGNRAKPKPKPKPSLVPANELDKMIADSLKDVSDEDDDIDTENDTELLGELQGIVGDEVVEENDESSQPEIKNEESDSKPEIFLPTTDLSTVDLIKQRMEMYKLAEANAKAAGESAKMRRFNRGLKTLNDLLKQASSGKTINPDDIPPEVSVKPIQKNDTTVPENNASTTDDTPKVPVRQAPLPPVPKEEEPEPKKEEPTSENTQVNPLVQKMRARQQEYKAAALQSKRAGDTAMALQYLKVVKQFDVVVKMCEDGQEVDLSDMPPPPEQFKEFMEKMLAASGEQPTEPMPPPPKVAEPETVAEPSVTTATNMLEALQQRLNKYKSVEESAKAEGNASKARRFGRIVKQYEDAIKAYKAGRPVAYDELPVPPGFGPLPVETATAPPTVPKADSVPSSPPTVSTTASTPDTSPTVSTKKPATPPQHVDLTTRTSGNQQKNNLAEHQMKILLDRQKEFKLAAIEAKKAGEIDQAKEYLKIYKGFDALLNAASSGLPVDLNTVSKIKEIVIFQVLV